MMLLAAINWHSTMFLLFALLACGFGVAVLATTNIVRMAFYLTLSLGATSGLFFLAGAEFLGSMQLLIYVGGTLVLLIFGVMLTAQARFISMKTSAGEWILGGIVGSSMLLLLLWSAYSVEDWTTPRSDQHSIAMADSKTSTPIGLALTGVRVDKLDQPNDRLRGGMSGYLLPFVIVSMHLLVVLIGAGYLARTKRSGTGILLDRPAPARVRNYDRRWPMSVVGGLVSGIAVNLGLAILCFGLMSRPIPTEGEGAPTNAALRSVAVMVSSAPDWLLATLGGLFLVNVLLLIVVWYWQRWGVVALVLVAVAQAIAIANAGYSAPVAVAFMIVALAPVCLLIILMCSGRRPTLWSQMD